MVMIATFGLVGMHQMSSTAMSLESTVAASGQKQLSTHELPGMTYSASSEHESEHRDDQGATSDHSCNAMTHGCASTTNADFTLPANTGNFVTDISKFCIRVGVFGVVQACGDPPDLHALSISRT